jgi:hypoxanthine phosphoribosyltransferase
MVFTGLRSESKMTFDEFNESIARIADRVLVDEFKPQIIVGIARGGWIPTRMLSKYLKVKEIKSYGISYADVARTELKVRDEPFPAVHGTRILLVEDFLESGKSLAFCKELLEARTNRVKTFAVGYLSNSVIVPDFSLGIVPEIPKLPWD